MTIYIVKWKKSIEADLNDQKRHYADSSLTRAKTKYKEILKKSAHPDSEITIDTEGEAITMHQPKTQTDVIELINSLN